MNSNLSAGEPFQNLIAIMEERHSTRHFDERPVETIEIEALHRAFRSAPQAGGDRATQCLFLTNHTQISNLASRGSQAYEELLQDFDSPLIREAMAEYGHNFFWFGTAPLLAMIIVRRPPAFLTAIAGGDVDLVWGRDQSAAMGVYAMLLAAEAMGLGGCCLSGPLMVRAVLEHELGLAPGDRLSLVAAFGRIVKSSPKKED
ncbi:MAG: nitroreductase family protein [Deltaproteobacteria bacterium]|nr:nitroreductase family protein [Deltaproteobacteria bacterium]